MTRKNVFILIACLAIVFAAGGLGALFTTSNIPTWYEPLAKPMLNPPNWLFGPVWNILYALIAVALFLVIKSRSKNDKLTAYLAFSTQLVLNALWSILFFGLHSPELGVGIIIVLLGAILWTMEEFRHFSKTALYLFVPYLLWVSFATYLNISIAVLN